MKIVENIDKRENLHYTIQKSTKNEDFAPFSNKRKESNSFSPITKRKKEICFEIGEKEMHKNNSTLVLKPLFLLTSILFRNILLFKRC